MGELLTIWDDGEGRAFGGEASRAEFLCVELILFWEEEGGWERRLGRGGFSFWSSNWSWHLEGEEGVGGKRGGGISR